MGKLEDEMGKLFGSGQASPPTSSRTYRGPLTALPEGWKTRPEWVQRCVALSRLPSETRRAMRLTTFSPTRNGRVVPSLQTALRVAQEYVRADTGPPWLILNGPRGVGKSHLAIAVAWELVEQGHWAIYYQVEDLLRELQEIYDRPEGMTIRERMAQMEMCDVLILDDLGAHKPTDWAEATLDLLVDYRYLRGLPLVVATNAEEKNLAPRLADRLWDVHLGQQVLMKAPSYRRG